MKLNRTARPPAENALRVLVVSDTHFTETTSLAGANPTVSGERLVLVQGRRMAAWVARVAAEHKVHLILHAGDVYEVPRPSPAAEQVVVDAFLSWSDVAPVVVIPGNHDRPRGGGTHALAPLRNIRPGRIVIADQPEPLCLVETYTGPRVMSTGAAAEQGLTQHMVIYPVPYPERSLAAMIGDANSILSGALDQIVSAHAVRARTQSVPTALMFHGTLANARWSEYQTAPASDIQIGVVEHWPAFSVHAIGHIHMRQNAPGTGGLPGYVGAPDRHDFGEEDDRPGLSLFTTGPQAGDDTTCEHIINPEPRRFVTLDLGLACNMEMFTKRGPNPADTLAPSTAGTFCLDHNIEPDETIYRIKGDVTPAQHELVLAAVRSWRGKRYIVANRTTVLRSDRVRVVVDNAVRSGDRLSVIDAVLRARPDLAEHAKTLPSDIEEIWP